MSSTFKAIKNLHSCPALLRATAVKTIPPFRRVTLILKHPHAQRLKIIQTFHDSPKKKQTQTADQENKTSPERTVIFGIPNDSVISRPLIFVSHDILSHMDLRLRNKPIRFPCSSYSTLGVGWVEHPAFMREVAGSKPGRMNTQGTAFVISSADG